MDNSRQVLLRSAFAKGYGRTQQSSAGQAALIAVILFIVGGLAIVSSFTGFAVREFGVSRINIKSKQTFILTDGALEDAVYRFKTDKNLPSTVNYQEGDVSAEVTVTTAGSDTTIQSQGNYNNIIRKETAVFKQLDGIPISLPYAAHAGIDGLTINAGRVLGNAFSNGNITCTSSPCSAADDCKDAFAVGTIDSACEPPAFNTTQAGVPPEGITPDDIGINIDYWKTEADDGDPVGAQTFTSNSSIGPKKINGDFILDATGVLDFDVIITGALHITGNFIITNPDGGGDPLLWLSDDFNSKGTVIIVEGNIAINADTGGGIYVNSSGNGIILIAEGPGAIISTNSAVIGAIIYVPNGGINISVDSDVAAAIGQGIDIGDFFSSIVYPPWAADALYSATPSGGGGPTVLDSWQESL